MSDRLKRLIPSPSMAVALLALFVALSGSAYAGVKLSKNSVTSKAIKKNAVTNAKIKNGAVTAPKVKADSLTGHEINESTLTGINAATVGGKGADSFAPASERIHFNVPMNRGDAPRTLATFGPFTLIGHCDINGATNFNAVLTVTSSSNASYFEESLLPANTAAVIFNAVGIVPSAQDRYTATARFLDLTSGFAALDGTSQPIGVYYGFPGVNCRYVGSFFAG